MNGPEALPLQRYSSASQFLHRVGPWLRADADELLLGIAERCAAQERQGDQADPAPLLGVVGPDQNPHAALAMLPGQPLCLAAHGTPQPAIARSIAEALMALDADPAAVIGPPALVDAFAEHFAARKGRPQVAAITETLHRLDAVVPAADIAGRLRPARSGDLKLLADWLDAAGRETLPAGIRQDAAQIAEATIQMGHAWLWEMDGEPVGMGMIFRETRQSAVLGGIHVTPARRQQGIATALVSAICRLALSQREFCLLNCLPATAPLYQRIGFRPVAEVRTCILR